MTQNTFAGNGTTGPFNFTFEYIDETDVRVSIDGVTQATTAYTFPTASTLQFVSLTPTASQTIRIFRETDIDSLKATFFAGSSIRSQDLNNNFEQNNFAVQEIKEQYVTEENGEFSTNVDMNSNRITDMADPVNAQDAVTKQYLEDNYFDDGTETIVAAETWPDNDTTIATTAAIDNRVDSKIDTAMENDVLVNDTGLTKSATGGQVTLGIAANSVDFDRIKDSDKITLSEQESDNDQVGTDDQIFTAQAATRRFNNYYQNDAPTATDGIGVGQVWVDPNDDLTLSVWTGSAWSAITSGGTFSNQPKVVYVDAGSGDDSNDGHRISRPKKTIRAALSDINADSTNGDGSIISVAPGIYAETLPLDIEKNDVGIIGQSLRTCIIHPLIPEADRDAYDVDSPHSQELQTMFRVNSGSYFQNLTLTGLKASGTRGASGSLYTDSTHGLPPNQGWNFAFFPDANIKKSPYIQNCTNFSDSRINNVPANFTPHVPGEGAAGDTTSSPTGGGILVDGSVPHTDSPLRSIVADSYTHTALDGPGILVTNNGYAQCTSSYAFFNHAHITCLNGGQANLAASTTDFGRFALVADGKSPTAIFTSNVDGAADNEATTFNINAPSAASDWFGDATRPGNNMLVTVNSVTYPVLSATPRTDSEGGAGFTVEISRPDTSDRSLNKGLNGAVSDNAAVSFFLRSMIASSGHTMEYVGSGTNYTALPENGGVPNDSNQIIEKNDGKVWTATTDHKGTFKVGDFFTVDQSAGTLSVDSGSFKVDLGTLNLNSDNDAVVGADLDMGSNEITASGANDLKLNAGGSINVQSNRIINVTNPTAAQDAATKKYVDDNTFGQVSEDTAPTLGGNLNVSTFKIISGAGTDGDISIDPNGTGSIVNIGQTDIQSSASDGVPELRLASRDHSNANGERNSKISFLGQKSDGTDHTLAEIEVSHEGTGDNDRGQFEIKVNDGDDGSAPSSLVVIGSQGDVGIGTGSPVNHDNFSTLTLNGVHGGRIDFQDSLETYGSIIVDGNNNNLEIEASGPDNANARISFRTGGDDPQDRIRIAADGQVGIGTNHNGAFATLSVEAPQTTANSASDLDSSIDNAAFAVFGSNDDLDAVFMGITTGEVPYIQSAEPTASDPNTRPLLLNPFGGDVGIGTTAPDQRLHVIATSDDVANLESTSGGDGPNLTFTHSGASPADNDTVGKVTFAATNDNSQETTFADIKVISTDVSDDSEDAAFTFSTRNNGTFDERVRIASDGHVGIGTTTPDGTLHVHSGTAGTVTANAGADDIVVENNGDVGISLLTADGNNTSSIFFGNATDSVGASVRWNDSTDSNAGEMQIGPNNAGAHLRFNSADGVEGMRLDAASRLLIGHTDNQLNQLQQISTTNGACLGLYKFGANDDGSELTFTTSRNATIGEHTRVDGGDYLGRIFFRGSDGDEFHRGAEIAVRVDGDPGDNDMPGRIEFYTTPNDTNPVVPVERMRIHSTGNVSFANGIVLGDGVADTANNTLDDYEEGTWTPAPAFGGTTTDVAGTFQGNYTKIGRLVTVFCALQFTNNGTGTGGNTIGGLPFEVADTFTANSNAVQAEFSGSVGFFANGGDRERATYGVLALSGTNNAQFIGGSNANHADLDVTLGESTIVDNSSIRFTLQYLTTA